MASVKRGHRIASGHAVDSPYPNGSIEMQLPHFKERGFDLEGYFLGTLNLSIAPCRFTISQPDYHFKDVCWASGFPPEDFLFVACELKYEGRNYPAYVYFRIRRLRSVTFRTSTH